MEPNEFAAFLVRAKRAAYASGAEPAAGPRPASRDLPYQEGDWYYLDSYLGGKNFIGEEAVWQAGAPVWGMNYYGWMAAAEIPPGFSPFLKEALMHVPAEAPFRGPAVYRSGRLAYFCRWEGELRGFHGSEWIEFDGQRVYELRFHGGEIR